MLNRRELITASVAGIAAAKLPIAIRQSNDVDANGKVKRKGRIKQSVCRWCYGSISLDDLCKAAAQMGLLSVELLDEKEWHIPKKHGLVCAMGMGPGNIADCWNRVENHDKLTKEFERLLPIAKDAGVPSLITFSGNRKGLADDAGMENCIKGIKRVAPLAEKHGVNIIFELLNSKVDHHDYQFDKMKWGVDIVKAVGSERFKILYDIYHAQIMEGDVIRTIRDNITYIGHFHTGGVPGRGEIDETQELNYSAICRAIAELGFKGYVSQEFCPTRDPLKSLRQAVDICDV